MCKKSIWLETMCKKSIWTLQVQKINNLWPDIYVQKINMGVTRYIICNHFWFNSKQSEAEGRARQQRRAVGPELRPESKALG
jgi:hypothetical protein